MATIATAAERANISGNNLEFKGVFPANPTPVDSDGRINEKALEKIIEDIRKNRCRSLSNGDVSNLVEDINEEMVGGRQMFRYLIDKSKPLTDEEIWAMTGERPNKKLNQAERWR